MIIIKKKKILGMIFTIKPSLFNEIIDLIFSENLNSTKQGSEISWIIDVLFIISVAGVAYGWVITKYIKEVNAL